MDANRFDQFVQLLSTTPRRGLLRLLAILPLGGGLAALLDREEADADGRRRRRKKRHKHGKGRHRGGRKNKCKAKSKAKICAGTCGTVKNNCKKNVDCGPCACDSLCPQNESCCGTPGACTDTQTDANNCGGCGQTCSDATPVCWNGECVCGDVCATGCQFSSVQEAIDAAEPEAIIRLCAETYGETLTIDKDLTLMGAGEGEDGTILDGQQNGSVVRVENGAIVGLEGLRITGGSFHGVSISGGTVTLTSCTVTGNSDSVGGGGIYTPFTGSVVILTNCTVSDNTTGQLGGGFYNPGGSVTLNDTSVSDNSAGSDGGGFYNTLGGTVTLNGTSSVTGNTVAAADGAGGGIYNTGSGTVTLNDESRVTENTPDDCTGGGTYSGNACGP